MADSWVNLFDQGWVFSVLQPSVTPQFPPLLLLHGLSGDETSLRSLSAGINPNRWIIAVRGMLPAPVSGYSWAVEKSRKQSDFSGSVNGLVFEWHSFNTLMSLGSDTIDLMGFSQGAALASLMLITQPVLIRRAALISGFIPALEPNFKPNLAGHEVLITHGKEDNIVPFAEALHSADILESFGAKVTFCQSNTRHKIGAHCLHQLETFFD